jgi:cytochrome c oxidase subunit 3
MKATTESKAFISPARESEADAFGMWIFIGSEAMLFGGLILIYVTARLNYPDVFGAASRHLSLPLGGTNTAVLLTSSFAMAAAHLFAQEERWRAASRALMVTAALGVVFLVIKGTEYVMEYSEGIAPVLGLPFHFEGRDPVHAKLFFDLYFAMTGLHALHLIGGIIGVSGILFLWRNAEPSSRVRRVQAIGLYWHFVDIVWVFLFPFLYLVDRL